MQKRKTYQQLQPEERMTIASMKQQGSSVRAMARTLGRSASSVSRELTRNTCSVVGYASAPAQSLSTSRREAARPCPKLHPQSMSWRVVLTLLEWKWSPQQISGTLKRMWPNDPTQHVSHETIYTAIYAHPRGELRRQLIACLRHGHSTRMSRKRGTDRRGQIPDMVSIHVRPPEVDDRVMPGHSGKATSSRAPATSLPWACWLSAAAAWCCWRRWKTPPPPRHWRASLPN